MTGGRPRYDHVIVGAGVAGCVLARRLADAGRTVLLLDAGSAEPSVSASASASFFDALVEPGRTVDGFAVEPTAGASSIPYRLGRGIGGGSAVNAMILTPAWPSTGDVAHRLAMSQADSREWGSVDRALVDAASQLGHARNDDFVRSPVGVGPAWLARIDGRRVSSASAYLGHVPAGLTMVGNTRIVRVETAGDRGDLTIAVAVADDGRTFDGDEIVLCAGAFESVAILLRSGISGPSIGARLQDHPSVRFGLRLHEPNDPASLAAATLLRWSSAGTGATADLQVLPLNHLGPTGPADMGGLVATLLDVRSTGSVGIDDDGRPVVRLGLLTDPEDRRRLREAARHMSELVRTEPFRRIVASVYIDDHGTLLDALPLDDDDALDRWMRTSVGDTYHAGSSLRMGAADDPLAAVDEQGRVFGCRGVRVVDASIFPGLPVANPTLPLVMLAERIATAILAESPPA